MTPSDDEFLFLLPDLGEGITEATVVSWHVASRDRVSEDDLLVEVETDKARMDLQSPVDAEVTRLCVSVGDVVSVGTPLVALALVEASGHSRSTPSASARPGTPSSREPAAGSAHLRAGVQIDHGGSAGAAPGHSVGQGRRVQLVGPRRETARRLTVAHREIPAVTTVEECDFSDVPRMSLSYLPYVLRAAARALGRYPEFNARLDGDSLLLLDRRDLGVAMQTPQGLVVPVIRDAQHLSLAALGEAVRRLSDAAREGGLEPQEVTGSTFSITTGGRRGGYFATPLINYPEVAILGTHRVSQRVVVRQGEIVVRRIGMISLTFDHRAADGVRAAEFLQNVVSEISEPKKWATQTTT